MNRLAASVLVLAALIAAIAVAPALNDAVGSRTSELPPSPATSPEPPEAASAQPGEQTDAPTLPADAVPPLPDSDLIVYNTLDGQIALIEPDGTHSWKITDGERFYAWPIWSPDGRTIAFSGPEQRADGTEGLALFIHSLKDRETRTVYVNERGMGPILPEMPHYPYFSPDGSRLAFMASVSSGLTLFVTDAGSDAEPTPLIRNAPLYASWSPDSDRLLVHGGADHYLVTIQDGSGIVARLGASAVNYRVPDWSSYSGDMAIVSQDPSGKGGIYTTDAGSLDMRLIAETPGHAAFLWSPDGELLAVARSRLSSGTGYDGVRLFSSIGVPQPIGIDDPVAAFFWSPDGSKLAYVSEGTEGAYLQWKILDIDTGETWPVAEFLPSLPQTTIFRFFDQFAHSHSPWSPDSRSLVFSGILRAEGVSASSGRQQPPQIIVAETEPHPAIDQIAGGFMAFWSPR